VEDVLAWCLQTSHECGDERQHLKNKFLSWTILERLQAIYAAIKYIKDAAAPAAGKWVVSTYVQ
jgi:hypothetical protein